MESGIEVTGNEGVILMNVGAIAFDVMKATQIYIRVAETICRGGYVLVLHALALLHPGYNRRDSEISLQQSHARFTYREPIQAYTRTGIARVYPSIEFSRSGCSHT